MLVVSVVHGHWHRWRRGQGGSLLMEIAIALAIAGALAGITYSAMGSMAGANERHRMQLLAQSMRDELLEFAAINNRFPCPDLVGNGNEGDASGLCPVGATTGNFPYRALGLDKIALPPPYVFRYGVLRDASIADLTARSASIGLSPVAAFRKTALAAVSAMKPGQPFIPVVTNSREACLQIGESPAVILAVGPPELLGSGPCFPMPVGDQSALAYVGRQELAGWLIARSRGSAG